MATRPFLAALTRLTKKFPEQSRSISSNGSTMSTLSTGLVIGAMAGAGMIGTMPFVDFGKEDDITVAARAKKTKVYTLSEMKQMCASGRIVVAYRGSLYDVTEFTE